MDKEDAKRFLLGQRIHLEEWKVRKLVMVLPDILVGRDSLRRFYYDPKVHPLMGKGTAYKVKKKFEARVLDPYLYFLDPDREWHPSVEEKEFGDSIREVLARWLAEASVNSLREVLRSLHFLGLLPEDLRTSAKQLILPLEYVLVAQGGSGKGAILTSFFHDMGHGGFQIEN